MNDATHTHIYIQTRYLPDTMDSCFLGPFVELVITRHEYVPAANRAALFNHLPTCDDQRDLSKALVYFFVQKRIVIYVRYQLYTLTLAPHDNSPLS